MTKRIQIYCDIVFTMNTIFDYLTLFFGLTCGPFSTKVSASKKACSTTLDLLPTDAATAAGLGPRSVLHVACLSQWWPSTSPALHSLTLGFVTTPKAPEPPQPDDGRAQGVDGNGPEKGREDASSAASSSSSYVGRDSGAKTTIAELLPPDGGRFSGFVPRVKLSPAFKHENITANIQVPSNGIGLVVVFRESLVNCACLSSRAFFCTATTCLATSTQSDDVNSSHGCSSWLLETVVSSPVFVQGCKTPSATSNTGCTQSRHYPSKSGEASDHPSSSESLSHDEPMADRNGDKAPPNTFTTTTTETALFGPANGSDDRKRDSGTNRRRSLDDAESQAERETELHCQRCPGDEEACGEGRPGCGECHGGVKECKRGICIYGCLPGYYGPSCNQTCPTGMWGHMCVNLCHCKPGCKCDAATGRCRCLIDEDLDLQLQNSENEAFSAYIIMSVSFAGGFIVGASLAGVCWCMRMSDNE